MNISFEKLTWIYENMQRIRIFEASMLEQSLIGNAMGVTHPSDGQEAVPVGICAHLTQKDWIGSTHRGHGHCISKGLKTDKMMAEILGRATGYCKGKGGSMHIADFSQGMLGANAIVGASIPLAVGAALTSKYTNKEAESISVSFFGDGASNQGILHESMVLAVMWQLPVIFACENNQYAEATPIWYTVPNSSISERAQGYGLPVVKVDGTDVFEVYKAAEQAVNRARKGGGPTFMELETYRFHGHFHADVPERYRPKEEEDYYKSRDPIKQFENKVVAEELMLEEDLERIRNQITDEISQAVEFALNSPLPDTSELTKDVYVSYSNSLEGLR